MGLVPAGHVAILDRYIGCYDSYATSHDALDRDEAIQQEMKNAAEALLERVEQLRAGIAGPGATLADPRPK